VAEGQCSGNSNCLEFYIVHGTERTAFALNVHGKYNGVAAALATAALAEIGVSPAEAAQAFKSYSPINRRLFPRRAGGALILDDSYNASPDSMMSGLESLEAEPGTRRIAVLGAMNDLGPDSPRMHRELGRYAAGLGIELLVTVGDAALEIEKGAREAAGGAERPGLSFLHFDTPEAAGEALREDRRASDVYLVKGSNSTRMNLVADRLSEADAEARGADE
jgi:UDP-N-acetylmuramoyl-tripeptide--D-alanyl-D-alanine ligase